MRAYLLVLVHLEPSGVRFRGCGTARDASPRDDFVLGVKPSIRAVKPDWIPSRAGLGYDMTDNFALPHCPGTYCRCCGLVRIKGADHKKRRAERTWHAVALQRLEDEERRRNRRKRTARKILRGHGRGQPGRDYIEQLLDTGDVDSNADTISVSY